MAAEMATVEATNFDGIPAWLIRSKSGATAVITERGANVVSWLPRPDVPIISGYISREEVESTDGGRSTILAPWVGEMADESYELQGHEYSVAGIPNVALGLIANADFMLRSAGSTLTLGYTFPGNEAYPFPFDITVNFSLDAGAENDEHLSVTIVATNRSDVSIPLSLGWAPYVTLPTASKISNFSLTIPARTKINTTSSGVPLGGEAAYAGVKAPVVVDYLGTRKFDDLFRGLVPDADGVVTTVLADPTSSAQIRLTQEPTEAPVLYVNSGDRLNRGARESILLAPFSHVPDAFNRYDTASSVLLAPGVNRQMTATLTYAW